MDEEDGSFGGADGREGVDVMDADFGVCALKPDLAMTGG